MGPLVFICLKVGIGLLIALLVGAVAFLIVLICRHGATRRRLHRAFSGPAAQFERVIEKHQLCVQISCRRFGTLSRELEQQLYQVTVELPALRSRIHDPLTMLPASSLTLEQEALSIGQDLSALESSLDRIAEFHAYQLGWDSTVALEAPWAAIALFNSNQEASQIPAIRSLFALAA